MHSRSSPSRFSLGTCKLMAITAFLGAGLALRTDVSGSDPSTRPASDNIAMASRPAPGGGASPRMLAVAAGAAHSLALRSDGTVWAWGSNFHGQLGQGPDLSISPPNPVQVRRLTGIKAIAAGGNHCLACGSEGGLFEWGIDVRFDPLAEGSPSHEPRGFQGIPERSLAPKKVIALAAGAAHDLALIDDGSVWAWGNNVYGQLGDKTTMSRFYFERVAGLPKVTAIAAGGAHSLAVDADGNVWAWGNRKYGQLGLEHSRENYNSEPIRVPGPTGIKAVAAGASYSLALKSDGTVWELGKPQRRLDGSRDGSAGGLERLHGTTA